MNLQSACITTQEEVGIQRGHLHRVGNYWRWRIYDKKKKDHVWMARFLYEQKFGRISEGYYCLHTCGNSECLNIDHLRQGTAQENSNDAIMHGRLCKKLKGISDYFEICRKYRSGEYTSRELGKEYNVSHNYILQLFKRYNERLQSC